jgi:glycosyltransferase involved in cell wall biosynthesis
MRILTVCTSTNVFGAEVTTLKMLEGFKGSGHEQLAVTSTWTDGQFNSQLKSIGIPEVRLPFGAFSKRLAPRPMWWTFNFLIRLPWLWVGWSRVLSEFNPEVVVLTSSRVALPVYPWLSRMPSFMIEHSYLEPTWIRRFIYRLLAKRLVAFVAVSKFMGKHLVEIGAPASKIEVVYNGLFSRFDPAKDPDRIRSILPQHRPARIGIVGQIAPNKGHGVLLEALRILRDSQKNVEVHVFGRGDDQFILTLSEKLKSYGLSSSWHWKGYESDITKIYQQLDMCIMPSSHEPFGLVAIEASAYALPIVVSNRGGLCEIVDDGVTGLLIDPDDPIDLSKKIAWLIDNPVSARGFGIQGQKKVLREFTQERMVAGYEELFYRSLQDSRLSCNC